MARNVFDMSLTEDELLAEVELTTALIEAATASPGGLSQSDIDAVLGVPLPRGE